MIQSHSTAENTANTRFAWACAVFMVLSVWGISAVRFTPQLPDPGFSGVDKLAHFIAYGFIATLWVRLRLPGGGRIPWWVALLVVSCAGLVEESIQAFNPFRMFEWGDWPADTLGAAVAVAAYRIWPFYRRVLEWHIPWGTHKAFLFKKR